MTTDAPARGRKFRRYWSLASPGIVLIIRRFTLKRVKADAERLSRCEPARSAPDLQADRSD
jgi:hypothetical protein